MAKLGCYQQGMSSNPSEYQRAYARSFTRSASERLQDIRKDVADVGPFMLQDKTKLISSLALLLVGSSIFYYLVIFLPKQARIKSSQELYERQLDCAKAGTKYMDELKEIRSRSYFTGSYFVKKISYNDELKTCLVRYDDGPYFGTKESEVWVSHVIDDVYSKQLVISSSDPSKDDKLEKFRQKELELFGTNY